MGDKKEQGQSSEGTPNPWIYNVAKRYPGQLQPGFSQPAERSYEPPPLPLPSQKRWRGRLLLWIAVLVLCLVIAAGIVFLSLVVK